MLDGMSTRQLGGEPGEGEPGEGEPGEGEPGGGEGATKVVGGGAGL